MDKPPNFTRTPLHARTVVYRGFARSDGLWDIEGHMVDTRDYEFERFERGPLEPGMPAHDMFIKVTLDDALAVQDIQAHMAATPFGECLDAAEPMRRLIGATMGKGWRKAIEDAMGGTGGCTHLRELLFNMATAAIQAIPPYMERLRHPEGRMPGRALTPPHFMGRCMSWRRDGPVVARIYPQFVITRIEP